MFFLSPKAKVALKIKGENIKSEITFSVTQEGIFKKKDFDTKQEDFFQSHANVFVLNNYQILHILEQKDFECKFLEEKRRYR